MKAFHFCLLVLSKYYPSPLVYTLNPNPPQNILPFIMKFKKEALPW